MKSIRNYAVFTLGLLGCFLVQCSTFPSKIASDKYIPAELPAQYAQDQNHQAFGEKYMVSSQGYWTSLAAKEIFDAGGNAVDAAVAASFTVGVERPQSTGIGGGGFMLIRLAKTKEVIAVDFREKAPLKSREKMFQDKNGNVIPKLSSQGILSSATPGMVAGLIDVHTKYGKLPLKQVMAPAIRLAEKGVTVYPHLATALDATTDLLKRFPDSAKIFLKPDGTPYQEGEVIKQVDLAKTLREISEKGRDGFYKGWVAKALLAEHRRLGGNLTQRDLDQYQVKYRKPVIGEYKGYRIYSMPPPSSGGAHVIEILNILEKFKREDPYSAQTIHLTTSAMQQAFADRSKYLADSDFVQVPLQQLTSQEYADRMGKKILQDRARKSTEVAPGKLRARHESSETTHFTLADRDGNIVSATETVNGWMGSGVVAPGAGFILNNEMDDFTSKPGVPNGIGIITGKENAIVPEKRPLSSMSPTLIEKDGSPVLAMGTPNGAQIITCNVLTILNYLDYKMSLYDSAAAVRYHHQWAPDEIMVDAPGFPPATEEKLKKMGYRLSKNGTSCKMEMVAFTGGKLHGVADPRDEGYSVGESTEPAPPQFKKEKKAANRD